MSWNNALREKAKSCYTVTNTMGKKICCLPGSRYQPIIYQQVPTPGTCQQHSFNNSTSAIGGHDKHSHIVDTCESVPVAAQAVEVVTLENAQDPVT